MSLNLYNTIRGVNLASFFILPMLNRAPSAYPSFRDCFTEERKFTFTVSNAYPEMVPTKDGFTGIICVLTRAGGSNRRMYAESIQALREMPRYLTDYDDPFDTTYATFVFAVPVQWRSDYDLIIQQRQTEAGVQWSDLSEEYRTQIMKIYPQAEEIVKGYSEDAKPC